LLNTDKYLVLGSSSLKAIVVDKSAVDKYPDFKIHYKHKNDVLMIKGIAGESLVFFEKYKPKFFEDYLVEEFKGNLKDPIMGKDWYFNNYKDRIIEQCESGVNFAGQYTIVSFGCGTACQQNLIFDRKTGKMVIDFVTSMGSDYRKNSSLLIRNFGAVDEKTSLIELFGKLEVNHMKWNGKKLKEIQ